MGRRKWVRLAALVAIVAVAADAASVLALGGAEAPSTVGHGLPVAQLVSIARGMVAGLGDRGVRTALVIATTKRAAVQFTYPGSEPPGSINARAFLIAIRGRFVCRWCSVPAGAKLPRGSFAYDIWVPDQGVSDFGLQAHIPAGLRRLGPAMMLPLTSPKLPAPQHASRPRVGIGPVGTGVPVAVAPRQIGPASGSEQSALGPLQLEQPAAFWLADRQAAAA